MIFVENKDTQELINSYPKAIRQRLLALRQLVIDTASETDGVEKLEETLKWGEPSYVTRYGSTIRMNKRRSSTREYAMYFTCTTGLVDTFRTIYPSTFTYEKNRALIFNVDNSVPSKALKHCISLALTYHKIKHLPRLGV